MTLILSEDIKVCECGEPIVFRRYVKPNPKTGENSLAPIAVRISPTGNVRLLPDGVHYEIVPAGERHLYPGELHVVHFYGCPLRDRFSRKGGR